MKTRLTRSLFVLSLALTPIFAFAGEHGHCNKSTQSCPRKAAAECKKQTCDKSSAECQKGCTDKGCASNCKADAKKS